MSKNIKSRENAEKKQKIKNIIFKVIHGVSYVCTGLFVAVCIVSCATSQRKQANAEVYPSEIQYRIDDVSESESETSSENPSFVDGEGNIILTANQVNNYTWENLQTYFFTNYLTLNNDYDFFPLNYNSYQISYDASDNDTNIVSVIWSGYNIVNYDIDFSNNINNKFSLYDNTTSEYISFENNLTFLLDCMSGSVLYQNLINAIQSDIQANEQSDDINVSIFDGITQSITSFIGTLNSGLTAIIGLFWNSTTSTLTPLGILTTLVVGVALFYFVFRLIQGLIRLRG